MKAQIEHLIDTYATHLFAPTAARYFAPYQSESLATPCSKQSSCLQGQQLDATFSAAHERPVNGSAVDKMLYSMAYLPKARNGLPFAKWLIPQLKQQQLTAVMAASRLRIANKHSVTEAQVADYLNVPRKSYLLRREAGVACLKKQIIRLEEYDRLVREKKYFAITKA